MQVYGHRSEPSVIADVLYEILRQAEDCLIPDSSFPRLLSRLEELKGECEEAEIRSLLPDIRRLLGRLQPRDLTIFLDDFHVVGTRLQPILLDIIYAVTRGNRVFLKLSAIETLIKNWDARAHHGLQIPHDAQTVKLDYNLTIPEKATEHIKSILDAHASYSALPSIRALCTSPKFQARI